MQVLVVDDDDFALDMIENIMTRMGYSVVFARDGRSALELLRARQMRLVITAWDMPEMTGLELCRAIRREEHSPYVYVIMLTAGDGAKQRLEGLCAGADDFLKQPLDPEELLGCLKTAEDVLSLETRELALFALAKLAESRDRKTGAHVERVQSYTRLIARNLSPDLKSRYGIDEVYIRLLYQASQLHDLGKVGIPDSILLKPGPLSAEEFAVMQTHTVAGAQMLEAALARFPNAKFLQIARDIAVSHHEKFDGSGYPQGLAGDQIPICGRIVAVADVYDALTSRRVYKDSMTHAEAKAILLQNRGRHFDPDLLDAFQRAEDQLLFVKARMSDQPQKVASQSPPPPVAVGAGSTTSCKILIAEDDPIVREKLAAVMAATGEPIFCASDGKEAVQLWEQHGPRVVVSDWVMPYIDGVELCRHIRAHAGAAQPHFIMLTTHSEKNWTLEAYQAGVDDFVSKPFDPEELLARVRAGIRATKVREGLATVNSQLEKLSITDELTGLFNRRHATFRFEEQWTLSNRHASPLSLAMIDIDHFKKINDTYGHGAGDTILREVAAILREHAAGTDAVCRMGGEEFLILLPERTLDEAIACAERCRAAVEQHKFKVGGLEKPVTISVGVAARSPATATSGELLKIADAALYAAKHSGRNTVRSPGQAAPPSAAKPSSTSTRTSVAAPALARPPVDMDVVLKRCGGDAKFAGAITQRFRAKAGSEVERAQKALDDGDADALGRVAHGLKSMTAYVSADSAADLAKRIEGLAHGGRLQDAAPLLKTLREEVAGINQWLSSNAVSNAA